MSLSPAARAVSRDPALGALVAELVASGVASSAVALVGSRRRPLRFGAAGRTRPEGGRPVRPTDRFDLASLTKPFSATLALALDAAGRLPLGARLGEIWGERAAPALATVPLEALLRHRSGHSPWTPLYRRCRSRRAAIDYLLSAAALEDRRERYGDLDFILWGLSAERALDEPYGVLLRRHVLTPLGLAGVGASPGAKASVVATTLGNERERALAAEQGLAVAATGGPPPGAVQDGNARFLGGLAAHAGLFGSVLHLWRLAAEWLAPSAVLSVEAARAALAGGRSFALGWRRRTLRGSGGPALAASAFGHLGFTGGSLFIDPESDRIVALLAHRVSVAADLRPWRHEFHRLALG